MARAATTSKAVGLKHGFRSGLEERINAQLQTAGVHAEYEKLKIEYTWPSRVSKYTPDWVLPNGIIVESKGIFDSDDRQKHLLVKAQHPGLDIRFIFTRSKTPLYKGSPTTYAMWCEKNGFRYADRLIPASWLTEPRKKP